MTSVAVTNVFIFTQNLKLQSFERYNVYKNLKQADTNVFITTHFLFENERNYLSTIFTNCVFKTFADFLTDEEMADRDTSAYPPAKRITHSNYIKKIKKLKNEVVLRKVLEQLMCSDNVHKYILSNDLGIDSSVWLKGGFKFLKCEYYYKKKFPTVFFDNIKKLFYHFTILKALYHSLRRTKLTYIPEEVHIAHYEGKKYVFLGKMDRIGYRFNIQFHQSAEECKQLNRDHYETKETCTYMTTWHEQGKCRVPDKGKYSVRWA